MLKTTFALSFWAVRPPRDVVLCELDENLYNLLWCGVVLHVTGENPPVGESSRLLLQTERKLFDDGLKLKIIATFRYFRLFGV